MKIMSWLLRSTPNNINLVSNITFKKLYSTQTSAFYAECTFNEHRMTTMNTEFRRLIIRFTEQSTRDMNDGLEILLWNIHLSDKDDRSSLQIRLRAMLPKTISTVLHRMRKTGTPDIPNL